MRTFVLGETLPLLLGVLGCVVFALVLRGDPNRALYCVLSVFGGGMGWAILLLYRFINYLVYFFWYVHETTTPLMDTLIASFGGPGRVSKQ